MTSADPGRTLGKYQLIAELARGGMAIVYLALVQGPGGFNKLVVVKELKPELIEEPAFLAMFLDEARLAAKLSHANIVQTNEVGNDGARYFMAMDYLDGRGLDRVRRRARASGQDLSLPIHLRVICDMLGGLHYAHTLNDFDGTPLSIVHRDVSPQNVFVTFDGQIKLLDFGIAKAADSLHETRVGVLKGKVSYMSPEQARGQKVDARADVFSAGVMLWEALTGRKLRDGQNDQQMLWALASADLPTASSIKPWVPPELDAICARAMAWDREQRYPSAGELQHELEHYLAATGTAMTGREVGLCVSELFREDRVRINAMIESHLARSRGEPDSLPVLDVAARGFTPSYDPASPDRPESGQVSGPYSAPQLTPPLDGGSATLGGRPKHQTASRDAAVPGGNRRRVSIIAGFALAAVAASVMIGIAHSGDDAAAARIRARGDLPVAQPSAPSAPSAAPGHALPVEPLAGTGVAPPPVAAAPASPALIQVKVRVSPDAATIAIDGAELTGNPFSGKYVGDGAMHHVRASAPGYLARTVAVEFTTSVALDISLERVPRPAAPPRAEPSRSRPPPAQRLTEPTAGPPPRPEPPSPPAEPRETRQPLDEEVNPAGGKPVQRQIDPNDPYGGTP